jgi:hypothetical protein
MDGEGAYDHCHETGHLRDVLHLACNSAEGKILHWAGRRSRGDDPDFFLRNLLKYWKKDYSKNPLHPSHGKPRRKRGRKRRQTTKRQGVRG